MVLTMMIFSILSLLLSLPSMILAIYVLIEFKAMKKSTHKIEYMPVPMPDFTAKQDKEFKETLNEDYSSQFMV